MIDDMVARKLMPGTQRGHVFACKQFAAYLGRSPETATPDDVRASSGIVADLVIARRREGLSAGCRTRAGRSASLSCAQ
jgi:hypothetical protein